MGKPFSCCFKRKKRKVVLLMLGLDNAGKTSAVKNFLKEENETVVPTVGFSKNEMKHKKFDVTMYDIGGGKNIRGIWKNYFALVHGVVFVVDSSDPQRFEEGKEVIESIIMDKRISGKPILLLVNKQDIEGALNEAELCTMLNLEDMINKYKCPTKLESSTALVRSGIGDFKDRGIELGFNWILNHIDKNFVELSLKVGKEMEEQRIAEDIEKKERIERVRRIKEEREKLQVIEESTHVSSDDNVIDECPFKPIRQFKETPFQKDSALRKSSVGANGPEEIFTEVIVHVDYTRNPERMFTNSAEETMPHDEILQESMELQSTSSPLKDNVTKKYKKKPFKNKIDPMKVPLCESLTSKEIGMPGASDKLAWDDECHKPNTKLERDPG